MPTSASAAKLKFETAMSQRLRNTQRIIPSRVNSDAPTRMPTSCVQKPTPDVIQRDLVVRVGEVVSNSRSVSCAERVADFVHENE